MKHILFCLIVWNALLISGCDPEEKIPAYIAIDSIQLITTPSQGTNSNKIKDAWVYIDNDLLGVYELPAKFPVLSEGNHVITIGAGVLQNGISATRIRYPFFTSYETNAELVPGSTVNLSSASVGYFPGITFSWIEDFEVSTNYSFDSTALTLASFDHANTEDPFEGNFSGKFELTTAHPLFDGQCTRTDIDFNSFSDVWLELNYKAEQPFDVGVIVNTLTASHREYALTVNTSDDWNKIYINLSSIIGSNVLNATSFQVYIHSELAEGLSESRIYLDNFKLIHN
jgi:hypothetical protein